MNIIFFTEGATLKMHFNLLKKIEVETKLDKIGIHVCDSRFFIDFSKKNPDIELGRYILLKEWEIIRNSKNTKYNIAKLKEYEEILGDPYLWNAILCDRRIYMGPNATFKQDYSRRYSHEEILSILFNEIEQIEKFFDVVNPDTVISFICVTLAGYLGYLIAKKRGIVYLNLRPTRIKNYFHAGDSVSWPSSTVIKCYNNFLKGNIPKKLKENSIKFVRHAVECDLKYEGVLSPSISKKSNKRNKKRNIYFFIVNILLEEYRRLFGSYKDDNWITGIIRQYCFIKFEFPIHKKWQNFRLKKYYLNIDNLKEIDYAFYPLHTEPEVSLLVYGRSFINQIEVIRNISRNLPVGMKLIIKEHPWSIGKRSLNYYNKILQIPNVLFVHPDIESRIILKHAKIVTVVSGTIAFEAILMKKPAITLGDCPFNCLPKYMVRNVRILEEMGYEIKDLLKTYKYDEKSLICYIASMIQNSVPIDFYLRLLERTIFWSDNKDDELNYEKETQKQFSELASYLIKMTETLKRT